MITIIITIRTIYIFKYWYIETLVEKLDEITCR